MFAEIVLALCSILFLFLIFASLFSYGAYVYFLDSGFPIFGSSVFWIILVSVPALSGFSLMVISVLYHLA